MYMITKYYCIGNMTLLLILIFKEIEVLTVYTMLNCCNLKIQKQKYLSNMLYTYFFFMSIELFFRNKF